MPIHDFRGILMATLLAVAATASAQDALYRWTDAQGQLHFSDQPPPTDGQPHEQLPLPSYTEPALSPDQAPYSILNQARRLEAARRQMQRERLEQQQRDREFALRRRALEAQHEQPMPTPPAVHVVPRPPRPPVHVPGYRPPVGPPGSGLWQPDHPAYRPYPRPHPAPRPRAGRIGEEVAR